MKKWQKTNWLTIGSEHIWPGVPKKLWSCNVPTRNNTERIQDEELEKLAWMYHNIRENPAKGGSVQCVVCKRVVGRIKPHSPVYC